jgi:hypothetical protein
MGGDVQPNSCVQQTAKSKPIKCMNPGFMIPLFPIWLENRPEGCFIDSIDRIAQGFLKDNIEKAVFLRSSANIRMTRSPLRNPYPFFPLTVIFLTLKRYYYRMISTWKKKFHFRLRIAVKK